MLTKCSPTSTLHAVESSEGSIKTYRTRRNWPTAVPRTLHQRPSTPFPCGDACHCRLNILESGVQQGVRILRCINSEELGIIISKNEIFRIPSLLPYHPQSMFVYGITTNSPSDSGYIHPFDNPRTDIAEIRLPSQVNGLIVRSRSDVAQPVWS